MILLPTHGKQPGHMARTAQRLRKARRNAPLRQHNVNTGNATGLSNGYRIRGTPETNIPDNNGQG